MNRLLMSWEDLEQAVTALGLLPYFKNKIPGFSVEENVPENLLWDITAGPWDWKGSVTRNQRAAYGKFYSSRAGYVSVECLPDFINIRRNRYVLNGDSEEARIYRILTDNESLLSRELKTLSGYLPVARPHRKSGNPFENLPLIGETPESPKSDSRFESAMTRLQMAGYVVIADFEYLYDRHGDRYGWGIARYTTPEAFYETVRAPYSAEESFERLFSRLRKVVPDASPGLLSRLIEGR